MQESIEVDDQRDRASRDSVGEAGDQRRLNQKESQPSDHRLWEGRRTRPRLTATSSPVVHTTLRQPVRALGDDRRCGEDANTDHVSAMPSLTRNESRG